MKKIIHAGDDDAEATSRRHVLRGAGLEVIAVPTGSNAAELAIERGADLIVVEPGPLGSPARASLATAPGVSVVDLNLDWETLTERLRSNELALARRRCSGADLELGRRSHARLLQSTVAVLHRACA